MEAVIYYRKWDGRNGSHTLLFQALADYLESRDRDVPTFLFAWRGEEAAQRVMSVGGLPEQENAFVRGADRDDAQKAAPEPLLARRDPHAKPYLSALPELKFSISHSGEWWACAVSDAEVGLDIQEHHTRNQERVARRFFHPDEVAWLERHGFEAFSRLWTYKESYVKYTGDGLRRGLDYFSVVGEAADRNLTMQREQTADPRLDAVSDIPGAPGVWQREIFFCEGMYLVLTAGEELEVSFSELS